MEDELQVQGCGLEAPAERRLSFPQGRKVESQIWAEYRRRATLAVLEEGEDQDLIPMQLVDGQEELVL